MAKVRTRLERHTVRSLAGANRQAARDITIVITRPRMTVHPLICAVWVMCFGGGSGLHRLTRQGPEGQSMSLDEQWVSAALKSSCYENFSVAYKDVLAFKAAFRFEERLEHFPGSEPKLFHFHSSDNSVSIWLPLKYPSEPPIVYLNGTYTSFPPADLSTTASMALRPKPPKLPPKPPSKPPQAKYLSSAPLPNATSLPEQSFQGNLPIQNSFQGNFPEHYSQLQQSPERQQTTFPRLPSVSQVSQKPAPVDLMNNVVLSSSQSSEKDAALIELQSSLRKCQPLQDPQPVFEASAKLNALELELKGIQSDLTVRKQKMNDTIKMLQSRTEAAEKIIERTDSQLVPPSWNELVMVADKPLEEARAADLAISDLLALLSKALDSGSLEMHVYLRLVRQYAREQFGHRCLLTMPPPRPPKPS